MSGYNEKIGGGGFHHIAFKAYDFEKSVKFYTEGLGFKQTLAWGEGDKRAVMLDTGEGNYVEIFAGGSKEPKPEGVVLHMAFRTSDCSKAIEAARAAGAEITAEPKELEIKNDPPALVKIGFCKGPDGEILEFFEGKGFFK